MKISIISIFISHLGFSIAFAYEPSGCNTLIYCNEITKNGVKNGIEICTDIKGRIVKEANWQLDKLEGKFKCLKEDGISSIEANYKNDELNGEYKEYLSNEKKWAVTNYKSGSREGLSIQPGSNGHTLYSYYKKNAKYGFTYLVNDKNDLVEAMNCEIDHEGLPPEKCLNLSVPELLKFQAAYKRLLEIKKNEKLKEYGNREEKYPSGKIMAKYFLNNNGQREGEFLYFYENGKIQSKTQYHESKKVGKETVFFDNGDKQEEITYNDRELVIERNSYFMNNKLNEHYKILKFLPPDEMRVLVELEEHHENGALYYKGKQIHSRVGWGFDYDGIQEYYNYEGELSSRSEYDMGKPVGTWYVSLPDQYEESTFVNGVLTKKVVFDKKTKEKIDETEFHPDRSVKKETKFKSSK